MGGRRPVPVSVSVSVPVPWEFEGAEKGSGAWRQGRDVAGSSGPASDSSRVPRPCWFAAPFAEISGLIGRVCDWGPGSTWSCRAGFGFLFASSSRGEAALASGMASFEDELFNSRSQIGF